ncbi:ABC transporter ATP-binding protein [Nocardia sp. NBC_01327]|uniref:ABC transporter ATP-binding protein n=1 Tax=Nocardia sp. NBC_01327 TaxID=2903593 RepID=UPI002E110793|nr:ABC transporter ATP-binding protein [Nocardia sp. NBC_01327]
MTNSLKVADLTLTFPDGAETITALDHVNLSVRGGEIAAITGPSGSGKSTLLAATSTLVRPDSGRVELETASGTVDLAKLSRREATTVRRDSIGIVFQQSNLIPALTALEQLEAMVHLGQTFFVSPARRREARSHASELLAAVGLGDHQNKRPAQLSGGQRQRVNIARALMNNPSLLVIDEPTSSLDQERGAAIIDLIVRIAREHNAATLLVTHDLSHMHQMDTVYRMVDGVLSLESAKAAA